ncbi:hypothetical protein HZA76_02830 [Candidatus Roizmanbacteria bacterium]|nr:hypothetical protein [Candidatus Roizmanbacteria bacterium]
MKKAFLGLIIIFTFLLTATVSFAETNFGKELRNVIKDTVQEGEDEGLSPKAIKQEVKENIREQVQERKENILDQVKNFIKKNLRFDVRIICTIDSIDTTNKTLSVNCDDSKSYTVNVTEKTRFVRKFGGKSDFSELTVGDTINVFGKFTDDTKVTVDARLIRDLSIQKRWGVFFGNVTVKNSDNFVISTIQRGELTVYFDLETKLLNHNKEEIGYGDIEVGSRVRTKGVWNKTLNQIKEVDEVRVFPSTPTPTLTPTPTSI